MDRQYIIKISYNKSKNHLCIKRSNLASNSIMITCVNNYNKKLGHPKAQTIPSNMSLNHLFEVAKEEHLKV